LVPAEAAAFVVERKREERRRKVHVRGARRVEKREWWAGSGYVGRYYTYRSSSTFQRHPQDVQLDSYLLILAFSGHTLSL